jgi:dsRNA-specific ribonuclease
MAKSKKQAEQVAAYHALKFLNQVV